MWKKTRIGEFLFERKETFAPDDKTIAGLKKIEKIKFSNGEICLGKYKVTNTKQIIVEPGDFVFSGLNIEKGAVSINLSNERLLVSTNYSTCGVDYKIINQDYLLRYINSSEFKELLIDNLKKDYGFTRPKHLLPLEIDLPNIKKQKEIVGRIKSIETEDGELKIELTYQQTLIKKLRQHILQEAIEGKLTAEWRKKFSPLSRGRTAKRGESEYEHASVLLERIIVEKNQMIKDKKIRPHQDMPPISDGDKPFSLPPEWVWCRLGDITSILGDGLHGTPNYSQNGEYYFVNGNNLINGSIQFKNSTKKVNKEEYLKYKKELNDNTILVSINGTLGNVAFYKDEKIILGKSACYFNLLSNLNKDYFKSIIESGYYLDYALSKSSQTTIHNLSLKNMKLFLIPLPPFAEQKAIAAKVEKLFTLCDQLETKITENKTHAEQLMRAVLKEMFAEK